MKTPEAVERQAIQWLKKQGQKEQQRCTKYYTENGRLSKFEEDAIIRKYTQIYTKLKKI